MTTRCANWCNRFLCRVPMCTGCGESMGCPEEPSPSSFNFKFYSTPLPWAMALAFCQARGGSLATIDSAAKQAEAVDLQMVLAHGLEPMIDHTKGNTRGQLAARCLNEGGFDGLLELEPGEPSGAHFGNEDCVCFNCAGARFGRPAPTTETCVVQGLQEFPMPGRGVAAATAVAVATAQAPPLQNLSSSAVSTPATSRASAVRGARPAVRWHAHGQHHRQTIGDRQLRWRGPLPRLHVGGRRVHLLIVRKYL